MSSALAGIRVLDCTTHVAGPFCAMLLADLGADVTKLEMPPRGDPSRYRTDESGYSPGFSAVNRGKRSLLLDLKSLTGQDVLPRLLKLMDVLIISTRPRARQKLGLAYDQIASVNPRLVYCSISGFGETEATRDKPSYNSTGQALSGLYSLLTTDFDRPLAPMPYLCDQLASLYACYGILAALLARERTGRGQEVKTSLLQAPIAFLTLNFFQSFIDQESAGGLPSVRAAEYLLRAGDGLPFAIHLPPEPEKTWFDLTDALGLPELRQDARFCTKDARAVHHEELHGIISRLVKEEPRAFWLELLERYDVPSAPVCTVEEVFTNPLVQSLNMLHSVANPWGKEQKTVGSGVSLSNTPTVPPARAPLPGEHNREILSWVGLSEDEIKDLDRSGVIATLTRRV